MRDFIEYLKEQEGLNWLPKPFIEITIKRRCPNLERGSCLCSGQCKNPISDEDVVAALEKEIAFYRKRINQKKKGM